MAQKKFSITLDTTEFQRSMRQMGDSYERLQKQMETSTRFPSLSAPIAQATREVDALGSSFQRAGALAASIFAFGGIQDFFGKVVIMRGEFQQLEISLNTMLGSAEQAKKLMDQLATTAARTPFDLSGIASSAKQLLAYGFAAEQVNDTILRLGDVAAGLSQPLGDIVYLYGTLKASGRVTNIDIRQFANRGIPIYEELAKVLGKNTDEINKLVSAGKVGFPDIEKAFANMTNEGGRFANLMQEQSKSITGQISNLHDNVDMMLNEIGKSSEGFISKGIAGVAFLVEHYEKVGKIIVSLIATYGVYRAAIITNIALTRSLAVAAKQDAIAKGLQTIATTSLTAATKKLTTAMLANPYGAIAVAITSVLSLMWAFRDSTSAAERAQDEYNKTKEEATKREEEHKRKVDALLSSVQSEASSTSDRRDALAQLSAFYPEIFEKYDTESIKLADIVKLKREIAELDGKKKLEGSKKSYEDATAEVKRLEELIADQKQARGKSVSLTEARNNIEELTEKLERARKLQALARTDYSKSEDERLLSDAGRAALSDKQLAVAIAQARYAAKRTQGNGGRGLALTNSQILGGYTQKEWEVIISRLEQEQKSRSKQFKAFGDRIQDAKNEEKKALKELQDFNAMTAQDFEKRRAKERSEGNYSFDFDEYQKKLKSEYENKKKIREELEKSLGGGKTKSSKANSETPAHRKAVQEEQRQREIRMLRESAKARRDAELQNQTEQVELMEEGFNRELALLEIQHKRKLNALDDQAQERLAKVQERLKMEWEATHDSKREVYVAPTLTERDLDKEDAAQLEAARNIANRAFEHGQEKLFKSLQEKYATFEERKTELAKRYQSDRDAIAKGAYLTEAQRASLLIELAKREQEELKRIDEERYEQTQKTNELLTQLFLQQGERTSAQMRDTISSTRELLSYLSTTKGVDLAPKFGMSADELRTIQESPEKLRAITEALKSLQGELASASPWQSFVVNMTDALDKGKRHLEEFRRARSEGQNAASREEREEAERRAASALALVGLSVAKVGKSVQEASPLVKELGQSLSSIFGGQGLSEQIEQLTDAMGDLGKAASSVGQIMSGDVLGGVTSIVSTIASVVSRSERIEREAEEKRSKALANLTRAQQEYNLELMRQNLLHERGASIFGEDVYGKARNAVEVARKALVELKRATTFSRQDIDGGGALDFLGISEGINSLPRRLRAKIREHETKVIGRLSSEDFSKLLSARVKTGSHTEGALWWKKSVDEFETLGKLYPQLIDKNGQLNRSLAETILKNHEFADGNKDVLEQAIALQKQVEDSNKALSDYMRGIFGQLGNAITDSLVAAFRRGEDATQAFTKSISEMLDNFIKQMAYSAVLAPIFEDAQKEVTKVMKATGLSDEDRFSRIASTMSKLLDEAKFAEPMFRQLLDSYDKEAKRRGFDTSGTSTDTRSAVARGIAQASQDSVDALTGLWHTNVLLSERTANAAERIASLMEGGQSSGRLLPTAADLGLDQIGAVQMRIYEATLDIKESNKVAAQNSEQIRFILSQMESNGIKMRK